MIQAEAQPGAAKTHTNGGNASRPAEQAGQKVKK
jgi:hypothetical protein